MKKTLSTSTPSAAGAAQGPSQQESGQAKPIPATKPGNDPPTRRTTSEIKARLDRLPERGRRPEPRKTDPDSTPQSDEPDRVGAPVPQPDNSNSATVDPDEHPYAALFPMVQGDEMRELAENIKTNGLIDEIVRYQGKLLDGRLRLAACKLAGVEPRFVEFGGDDAAAVQFVLAKNICRRNLSKSQRAAIAADLLALCEKRAAERKRLLSGTRKNPDGTTPARQVTEKIPGPAGEAREQVARMLDVNARYVSDAKEVREADPELHEQVRSGKKTLQAAKKQLSQKTGTPRDPDRSGSAKAGRETVGRQPGPPRKWERGALTVVVWDHESGDDEPTKFYGRNAYPNCVLFHIWRRGTYQQNRTAMSGYNALLTLLTDHKVVHDNWGIQIRSAARFVSISSVGDVPKSGTAFDGVLRFSELLRQVEKAWPTARKVLFGIPARKGWEVYIRQKRK